MKNKKASAGPGSIAPARTIVYTVLGLLAIVYMAMLSALTLFSLAGFSFKSQHVNLFLNVVSVAFFIPTETPRV